MLSNSSLMVNSGYPGRFWEFARLRSSILPGIKLGLPRDAYFKGWLNVPSFSLFNNIVTLETSKCRNVVEQIFLCLICFSSCNRVCLASAADRLWFTSATELHSTLVPPDLNFHLSNNHVACIWTGKRWWSKSKSADRTDAGHRQACAIHSSS